jgi:hypothetical protein
MRLALHDGTLHFASDWPARLALDDLERANTRRAGHWDCG